MAVKLICAVVMSMPLVNFEEGLPGNMAQHHAEATVIDYKGSAALQVQFGQAEWPNVYFTPGAGGVWDWSDWTGIRFRVVNPGALAVAVAIRVDNAGEGNWLTHTDTAPPGSSELACRFNSGSREVFWGMRGVPELGALPMGPVLDLERVTAFQLFLPHPVGEHALLITGIELFGPGAADGPRVAFPFVDRFGQYQHGVWPGKVVEESELAERARAEAAVLEDAPLLPGRDAYGGWRGGPALEATGWFRVEERDGVWWLVTPEGRLFWSSGITCIAPGDPTFIEGREEWFEGLPAVDGPMGRVYGRVAGAHSMAERIGGEGRTVNLYQLNLLRKYGADWGRLWRAAAYGRLRHWGMTTLGNWSQWGVLEQSPVPFTVSASIEGVRLIEGGGGYWRQMTDVYDAGFAEGVERAVAGPAGRFGENPLCMGYFVDNELSWGGIAEGALASPAEQPCRMVFVEKLKEQYGTIDVLNGAWKTNAASWDALRLPSRRNDAAEADRIAFERAFAGRYFRLVQETVNRLAPNQLYLGCRFAGAAEGHIMEAAAAHSDVVSINAYYQEIAADSCAQWTDWGRPVLIGEFHFGALDRGSFHGGLSPVASQEARAAAYTRYLESALDCGAVVGAHWFQYVDQPLTGRWYDGENYNIGFVDITDTPYPELVEAARGVHGGMYQRRVGLR